MELVLHYAGAARGGRTPAPISQPSQSLIIFAQLVFANVRILVRTYEKAIDFQKNCCIIIIWGHINYSLISNSLEEGEQEKISCIK
jgi:hypothetical protein